MANSLKGVYTFLAKKIVVFGETKTIVVGEQELNGIKKGFANIPCSEFCHEGDLVECEYTDIEGVDFGEGKVTRLIEKNVGLPHSHGNGNMFLPEKILAKIK